MMVKCIDNTLAADELDVGRVYEVTKVRPEAGNDGWA
jgi:hypothetical protein